MLSKICNTSFPNIYTTGILVHFTLNQSPRFPGSAGGCGCRAGRGPAGGQVAWERGGYWDGLVIWFREGDEVLHHAVSLHLAVAGRGEGPGGAGEEGGGVCGGEV